MIKDCVIDVNSNYRKKELEANLNLIKDKPTRNLS